jgi:hypothetical protein
MTGESPPQSPPPYRFGVRERRALTDIRSDIDFLVWGDGHNAAVVLSAHAEDALLRKDDDSPSDSLDRGMLAMSLASQWSPEHKDSEAAVLTYVRTLRDIGLDDGRTARWHLAGDRLAEGAHLHSSQPVRALELYNEALKLFEDLGDEKGAGRCRGNIGLLLLNHKHVEEGVRECMKALELHVRVHYHRGCLMHLVNVVGAAKTLERWEDALARNRDRLLLALSSDPTGVAAVHADAGWFALQLGRRDEAESSYRQAVAALDRVQTPAGFKQQLDSLGALAHALGHVAELQDDLPRLQQQISQNLQTLAIRPLAPAANIVDKFRQAMEHNDDDGLFPALAQSECWSAFAFEQALAAHATAVLIDEQPEAERWDRLARRFGLAYCRSFLDRGPFDEYALYSRWTQDQRLVKARAYALKISALDEAAHDQNAAAHASLTAALELHAMIGDRDAAGRWFPEAFRELSVPPASRSEIHRLMFRAAQESSLGSQDDEQRTLKTLLDMATRDGTTLDVADACTRLGIHYFQAQRAAEAAEWFARAEQTFRTLESIGMSVRDETGRAHNKLKMSVHLLEFLERRGRYGEAAFVGVAALREAGWFIESFRHFEYVPRAMDYKSRMLHALARSYERLGGYEKSLAYADQLRGWAEETGDRSALAAAHHSRAAALRDLWKLSEAMTCAQADADIQRELGDRRELAVALVMCAELSADLGDAASARRYAMEALELAGTSPRAASSRRDARYVLARLAEQEDQPSEAIRLYADVLAEEEGLLEPGWIHTASVLAERLLDADRGAEALALAERAWDAADAVHSHSLRLAAGCALAKCLLPVGTPAAIQRAIEILLACCGLVETIRREMKEESHKTSAAVAWVLPFDMLLSTLLRVIAHDPDPSWKRMAFETAERAKARALAESIAASAARDAEAQGYRLSSMSFRPVDPREEITRAEFTALRDMLRGEEGPASGETAALA